MTYLQKKFKILKYQIKNLNLTIEKKGGRLILLDDIPKPCSEK